MKRAGACYGLVPLFLRWRASGDYRSNEEQRLGRSSSVTEQSVPSGTPAMGNFHMFMITAYIFMSWTGKHSPQPHRLRVVGTVAAMEDR